MYLHRVSAASLFGLGVALAACGDSFAQGVSSPGIDKRSRNPVPYEAECDRLAASPYDPNRPSGVPGVKDSQIQTNAAISACTQVAQASGNPRHWFQLGRALEMAKDHGRAAYAYRVAADEGYAPAQTALGYLYDNGMGVPRDYYQAVAWLHKAANQGDMYAQFNLGNMYWNGKGVAVDVAKAVALWRAAAKQGEPNAQYNIGTSYLKGTGVTMDYAQAISWYRASANQEHPSAQLVLGLMYGHGMGVAKDYTQAATWIRKAARNGDQSAIQILNYTRQQESAGWTLGDAAIAGLAVGGILVGSALLKSVFSGDTGYSAPAERGTGRCADIHTGYLPDGTPLFDRRCD